MTFTSALITGASSGLGRAMALELGRRGAFIYVLARRKEALDSLVAELEAHGAGGRAIVVDVGDIDALKAAIEEADAHAEKQGDGLDLVIANAGIAEQGLEGSARADAAHRVLHINAIAAVCTLEFAAERMRRRGRGHLCGISSLAGMRGVPDAGAYSSSKAALQNYIESMHPGLRQDGLTITDVQPGFVRTPMTDKNDFKMPFLLAPDAAARRTIDALEKQKRVVQFPKRLAWPMRVVASLAPAAIWERLATGR